MRRMKNKMEGGQDSKEEEEGGRHMRHPSPAKRIKGRKGPSHVTLVAPMRKWQFRGEESLFVLTLQTDSAVSLTSPPPPPHILLLLSRPLFGYSPALLALLLFILLVFLPFPLALLPLLPLVPILLVLLPILSMTTIWSQRPYSSSSSYSSSCPASSHPLAPPPLAHPAPSPSHPSAAPFYFPSSPLCHAPSSQHPSSAPSPPRLPPWISGSGAYWTSAAFSCVRPALVYRNVPIDPKAAHSERRTHLA